MNIMWPVLSIGISLVVIIVLLRKKVTIAPAMFIGALISAVGSGLGLGDIVQVGISVVQDPATWELALTIAFISIMGTIMSRLGIMETLVDSLQKIFKDTRYILVALPSLIGMLMVPGGAIMSAPLVQEVGEKKGMSVEKMTVANIMFRHVWYLAFPLFPSMILASNMANVNPGSIVLFNGPLGILGFLVTFWVLFGRKKPMKNDKHTGWDAGALQSLSRAILPMVTAVILALFLNVYFPLAIAIGLFIIYIYQWKENRLSFLVFLSWLWKSIQWPLVMAIFGIMFFKEALAWGGGVEQMASFFLDRGVPLLALVTLVPFLGGYITGSNTANIAISFPLFVPMLPEEGYLVYVGFMYAMSVVGYLVSPIHLCFLLTLEHFKCSLTASYRYFLAPTGVIIIGAFMIILMMRGIL